MPKVKNRRTTKRKDEDVTFENSLPQNIVAVGEHVEENKNIYILQNVYKDIHKFTRDKTTNESGGVLMGNVIEEFGKTNIIIKGFIEAKYCEGTPTTLTFTHKSWEYIHKEAEKRYPDYKIVGWIHTHPNFGIFLSEYDLFIQNNFFSDENQIAFVVDPIQKIEGFYFRINNNIERCKGFYVFDKTGKKIKLDEFEETDEDDTDNVKKTDSKTKILLYSLTAAVVIMFLLYLSLNSRLNSMIATQRNFQIGVEQTLYSMQNQINALQPTTEATTENADAEGGQSANTTTTTQSQQ